MLTIIPLITAALQLANTLLEGIPIQDRQAQARVWFLASWPITKGWLKLSGVGEEQIRQVEEMMK
jgi:hypothetical protein